MHLNKQLPTVIVTDPIYVSLYLLPSVGINQLSIKYSNSSNSDWSDVMTGNMVDVRNMACEKTPSQSFKVQQVARYIKMDMESYYGSHAPGFKYLNVDFEDPSCGMRLLFFVLVLEKQKKRYRSLNQL